MIKVYSHPNLSMVHLVKHELDNRGISSVVRGEHAAALVGAGAGIDAWAELWVADDVLARAAAQIIRDEIDSDAVSDDAPWTCPACGETVEPPLALCWNCGAERPDDAA